MSESKTGGTLFIVATPIGNLDDMVPRAINILHKVALIAAEDTRHSGKLLQHFGIATPTTAYHDFSDDTKTAQLIAKLQDGNDIALISDAGTPLISDPGYALVAKARAQGLRVEPIPGPCAIIAALCASGLPSDRFSFEGFLPAKPAAKSHTLAALKTEMRTLIFYESPHRIEATLATLVEVLGPDRQMVLARELTKTFETFLSGTTSEVAALVAADANQKRGEMVLLIKGYEPPQEEGIPDEAQTMLKVLCEELPLKKAAALTAKLTSVKKNALYQWGLEAGL